MAPRSPSRGGGDRVASGPQPTMLVRFGAPWSGRNGLASETAGSPVFAPDLGVRIAPNFGIGGTRGAICMWGSDIAPRLGPRSGFSPFCMVAAPDGRRDAQPGPG